MTKFYMMFPAYNEQLAIEKVLRETDDLFKKNGLQPLEFVVVDDGSRDATPDIINGLKKELTNLTVLQHEHNKGLGAALNTGMIHIIERAQDEDIILTGESDGCQDLQKLVLLAREVEKGSDLAVASPLIGEGFKGVPFYRKILSKGANIIYGILFPMKDLHDYTNLNRAFRAKILKKALQHYGKEKLIDRPGFEAVPDIILKLRKQEPTVSEVPIVIDFTKIKRNSSMNIQKTIVNSLVLCWDHLFNKHHKGI